jgi:two-component system cell cycle sensor histidine kinase PleC
MEGKAESTGESDRYLAHLAHELRTPLTAIIGYAEAMSARTFGPLDERYAEYAEIIGGAGRHMLALAEDLLARARVGEPLDVAPAAPCDAAEAVAWALRLMTLEADAAGVALDFAPGPALPTWVGDRGALAQMVVNLVANAIRHTPAGGVVRVTLDVRKAGLMELTVSDTGPGLAPGAQTAGMGLRLVRKLVETRSGTVSIGRAPGGGACVVITLPTADTTP